MDSFPSPCKRIYILFGHDVDVPGPTKQRYGTWRGPRRRDRVALSHVRSPPPPQGLA